MNPDLALHEFHKTISNDADEMRVYTVLAAGEVVYQQVLPAEMSCQVDLTLAFHKSVKVEFSEAWAPYYPDDQAINRREVSRAKLIKAVLKFVGEQYDEREDDPGWQFELYEEMLADAAKEYAAELRGFVHMPKYLDDRLVKEIQGACDGIVDDVEIRRLWHTVRKSLKLDD